MQAPPGHRTCIRRWRVGADDLEKRGHEVRHDRARADASARGKSRSRHDQRHAQRAVGAVKLVEVARRSGCARPLRADGDHGAGAAQFLDAGLCVALGAQPDIEDGVLAVSQFAAFRPIVGGDHEDRVLVGASLFQISDESADVEVHCFEHARVHFHGSGCERPLGAVQ